MFSLRQPYEYIITVDFEATCFADQPAPQYRKSEIIEFPAVLMNLKTGKIEAEFHKYLRPTEKPQLSNYCINLTGISQRTVDQGISLQQALIMFETWLSRELKARNLILPHYSKEKRSGNCVFVTWSDWDFGTVLEKECTRKYIKKPQYFNQWINIRHVFWDSYKYKPIDFPDALRCVGLKFVGKEHSGLDDARNTAIFTHKLVEKGIPLKITKNIAVTLGTKMYFRK